MITAFIFEDVLMGYALNWSFGLNYMEKKEFTVQCNIDNDPIVKSFSIKIAETYAPNNLSYSFDINYHCSRKGCTGIGYNPEETKIIGDKLASNFSIKGFSLYHNDCDTRLWLEKPQLNPESITDCCQILFTLIDISTEDKDKIFAFIQEGIFSDNQMLDNIYKLISPHTLQKAFDKAILAEHQGYPGILFEVASSFLGRGYIQPAYLAFSNIPASSPKFIDAQLIAANLASKIDIPDQKERLKIIFTHCLNAGKQGQPIIDETFKSFTGLSDSKHSIKNVKPDFDTLMNLASIIAAQNNEIEKLKNKNNRLTQQLDEKNEASYHSPKFF